MKEKPFFWIAFLIELVSCLGWAVVQRATKEAPAAMTRPEISSKAFSKVP